jgi:hypothetical protein
MQLLAFSYTHIKIDFNWTICNLVILNQQKNKLETLDMVVRFQTT